MAPVPLPHILKGLIDDYVVGQELAKKDRRRGDVQPLGKRYEAQKNTDVRSTRATS